MTVTVKQFRDFPVVLTGNEEIFVRMPKGRLLMIDKIKYSEKLESVILYPDRDQLKLFGLLDKKPWWKFW